MKAGDSRTRSSRCAAVPAALALLTSVPTAWAWCDRDQATVYRNAQIHTMNERAPSASWMAVCGSEIAAVGKAEEREPDAVRGLVTVDLEGRVVMPGFVDTHSHFVPDLRKPDFPILSLEPGISIDEVLARISSFARANPVSRILWVDNFDISAVTRRGDEPRPTSAMLDEIDKRRPIVVIEQGHHALWFNTAARVAAGVDRRTPDPVPGAHFFVRDETGMPNGWANDLAMKPFDALYASNSRLVLDSLPESFRLASEAGITTTLDAGTMSPAADAKTPGEYVAALAELEKQERLPFRISATVMVFGPEDVEMAIPTLLAMQERFDSDWLAIKTLKIHVDPDWDQALLWEGLATAPGRFYPSPLGIDNIELLTFEAYKHGLDVHYHVMGDRAATAAIDAADRAMGSLPGAGARITMSHIAFIRESDAERMADLGIYGSVTLNWGRYRAARAAFLGEKRFTERGTYPFGMLHSAGVQLVYGSDYPVMGSDWIFPFANIEVGMTRQDPGDPESPIGPLTEHRLTDLGRILHGYTLGAAQAIGMDAVIGSLQAGKKADFIVIDRDPFETPVYELHRIAVLKTIVDGREVFRSSDAATLAGSRASLR